jgi:hypothetical protein
MTVTMTTTPLLNDTTPIPTVAQEDVDSYIEYLLTSNADCRLPCVWGIVPGETQFADVAPFMESIGQEILQGGLGSIDHNGEIIPVTSYGIYFPIDSDGDMGLLEVSVVVDGVVLGVSVNDVGTNRLFKIEQVLQEYGPPTSISIWAAPWDQEGLGFTPYYLILSYIDDQFLVYYAPRPVATEESIIWCYQPIGPRIETWESPGIIIYEEIISNIFPATPFPIEEISDLDQSEFYNEFLHPSDDSCIQIDMSFFR